MAYFFGPPDLCRPKAYGVKILPEHRIMPLGRGWLKMLDMKMTDHQNCRAWNCQTWNWWTNVQDMKMPDMKLQAWKFFNQLIHYFTFSLKRLSFICGSCPAISCPAFSAPPSDARSLHACTRPQYKRRYNLQLELDHDVTYTNCIYFICQRTSRDIWRHRGGSQLKTWCELCCR